MSEKEIRLMKGNEALAHAAIRYGVDAFFGYPITPATEIMEAMMEARPWKTTGMTAMQVESEVASINMVYGAAATGHKAFTASSGPGISLMQNGISYMAGANLPGVIVNVMRGGPGLGTIQPSQSDYFQAVKGGGHGDYKLYTLAPASVQEMADFVAVAFDWAFEHRNPAIILADGTIGQMMEKVVLPEWRPRLTNEEIAERYPWVVNGTLHKRSKLNRVDSLELDPAQMEIKNQKREAMYREVEKKDVRYEAIMADDAEILVVAFGSAARVCTKAIEIAREKGIRLGLIRPITLWPFPTEVLRSIAKQVKGMLVVELNAGQMIEDVRLAVNGSTRVEHYGRMGGVIFTPDEVVEAVRKTFIE